ncbi:MAG: glycosyltransferase family protein, partial [Rhodobacterales bacterium]
MKVSIVVTHLLGTGHLARALTLGRAYTAAGHDVQVVSGGMPAPQLDRDGVDMVQLPPLRSDGVDFARLLDDRGDVASDAVMTARREMLVTHIKSRRPDLLIT